MKNILAILLILLSLSAYGNDSSPTDPRPNNLSVFIRHAEMFVAFSGGGESLEKGQATGERSSPDSLGEKARPRFLIDRCRKERDSTGSSSCGGDAVPLPSVQIPLKMPSFAEKSVIRKIFLEDDQPLLERVYGSIFGKHEEVALREILEVVSRQSVEQARELLSLEIPFLAILKRISAAIADPLDFTILMDASNGDISYEKIRSILKD